MITCLTCFLTFVMPFLALIFALIFDHFFYPFLPKKHTTRRPFLHQNRYFSQPCPRIDFGTHFGRTFGAPWLHFWVLGPPFGSIWVPSWRPLALFCILFGPSWRSGCDFEDGFLIILDWLSMLLREFFQKWCQNCSKNDLQKRKPPFATLPSKGPERNLPKALRSTFGLPVFAPERFFWSIWSGAAPDQIDQKNNQINQKTPPPQETKSIKQNPQINTKSIKKTTQGEQTYRKNAPPPPPETKSIKKTNNKHKQASKQAGT